LRESRPFLIGSDSPVLHGWLFPPMIEQAHVDFDHTDPRLTISTVVDASWMAAIAAGFLCLAQGVLVARMEPAPSRLWIGFFRRFDGLLNQLNEKFGNVAFSKKWSAAVEKNPILWRECASRLLARPLHLLRLSVALFVVAIGLIF